MPHTHNSYIHTHHTYIIYTYTYIHIPHRYYTYIPTPTPHTPLINIHTHNTDNTHTHTYQHSHITHTHMYPYTTHKVGEMLREEGMIRAGDCSECYPFPRREGLQDTPSSDPPAIFTNIFPVLVASSQRHGSLGRALA